MGLCITHLHHSEQTRRDLWDVWQAVCAARETYRARILGMTGTAKGANIGMVPDRIETDQSFAVDLRTPEERDTAAKRANEYWSGLIAALPTPQDRWALQPAMDDIEGALWRNCAPTPKGIRAVAALVFLRAMHARP